MLMQLILLNGFSSSADLPGVEKLCATWVQKGWLSKETRGSKAEDLGWSAGSLVPEQLWMVKGWNRSVCLLGCLYACFADKELLEAGGV